MEPLLYKFAVVYILSNLVYWKLADRNLIKLFIYFLDPINNNLGHVKMDLQGIGRNVLKLYSYWPGKGEQFKMFNSSI